MIRKNFKFIELKNYFKLMSLNIETNLNDDEIFSGVESLQYAKNDDMSFFNNDKYLKYLKNTNAKACFIEKKNLEHLPKSCSYIIVEDPYLAYAILTNFIKPSLKSNGVIEKSVVLSESSNIGKNVQLNNFVTIDNNTSIGDNCIILENCKIGPNVKIDNNTIIMQNCVITDSLIGSECTIQSGTIIGGKGFGFTPNSKIEVKHIGNVVIGNNVDIGSNTTIDRGAINSTIIESNVRLDNQVHVAHNVIIKQHTIIAAQTGIAGSTTIGEKCTIGGQAGISGHLIIGNNVTIAGKSGVTKNISDNQVIAGFPAIDIRLWKKNIINQLKKIK